jgi:hypothetical protein
MQYLLLIYANEAEVANLGREKLTQLHHDYLAFTKSVAQSGNLRSNNGLRPVSTATTVRVRNDKTVTTDGPFAETREQLAGYFLIEAKDLDEAIAIAARIPTAKYGSVEVRPVWSAEW